MKIIIASNNQGKIEEIKQILNIEVKTLKDLNIVEDIEEFGLTFEQNALIKAQAISKKFPNDIIISDDSGIEVRALDYAPGVYTKRFSNARENIDFENNKLLLAKMEGKSDRYARFKSVVCVYSEKYDICSFFSGCVEGEIGHEIDGVEGFGYDPIFIYENKSFARLSIEEKNSLSHRFKALSKLQKSGVLNV